MKNYQNYLFQKSDERMMNETNLIAKADIKVDSEEFCQANYDGMKLIIICSSTVLMCLFYCYLYDLFQDYISIHNKYKFLYSTVFDVVFFHAEKMTSVSNEIYVKEEASCSSLESDQVCSVFFMTLLFIIDIIFIIDVQLD